MNSSPFLRLNRFPRLQQVMLTLTIGASVICARPAAAQGEQVPAPPDTTKEPTTLPALSILSIALPPQARLRIDIDARDKELLGVVKSLLRGFNGDSLKSVVDGIRSPTHPPVTGTMNPFLDLNNAATLQMLSEVDLEKVLHDINHLRAVIFEMPRVPRKVGTVAPQSILAFYEQKYVNGEGGHRIMRADFDEVQMLTVGFPEGGFAVIFQAPGLGWVVRSDGYPNLDTVGPLATAWYLRMTGSSR